MENVMPGLIRVCMCIKVWASNTTYRELFAVKIIVVKFLLHLIFMGQAT